MRTYSIPLIVLHIVVACSLVTAAPSSATKDIPHADGIGMTFMSIWSDGTAIAGNVLAEDLQRALPWDPDRDRSGGPPVPINLALHLSRQFLKSAFPADKWSLSKLELRERSGYWFYLIHFRRGSTTDLLRIPVLLTGAVAPMEVNPEREVVRPSD